MIENITADPTDLQVGARIRLARRDRGMSQTDLARGCGVTFQQLQKYENASNRVSASRLLQIAAALKLPISYFFEGLEKEPTGDAPVDGIALAARLDPNVRQMIGDFVGLERRDQRLAMALLQTMSIAKSTR